MTAERRFGNHIKRHEQMQESYYRQDYLKTLADKFDNFVRDDPNLFENESPKQI